MKEKSLTAIMTGLFLILVFSFLGYQRQHKPRVFILHSYNEKMPWVEGINQGIDKIFKDKAYINLRYFYMDTKRRDSSLYQERITKAAIAAIHAWKPDVLLTFDHEAQALVARHFSRSKSIKIIMAGITDNRQWQNYKYSDNMTAITEEIPVTAIREILSLVFRQKRRIYYLSDDSQTSRALEKNMLVQDWGGFELTGHRRVKTLKEWKEAVHEAEAKADILLLSMYSSLKNDKGHRMNTRKLVSWTNENSSIPVVGVYESFIIDGGWISIAISSLEQGYSAAWLASNLIEKKLSLSQVPLLKGKNFSLFIDKSQLKSRFPEAQIPIILDAFSKSNEKLSTLQSPDISATILSVPLNRNPSLRA